MSYYDLPLLGAKGAAEPMNEAWSKGVLCFGGLFASASRGPTQPRQSVCIALECESNGGVQRTHFVMPNVRAEPPA
jgi:hypothetical protein